MLDLALFRDPHFTVGALAIGLTFFAMFATIFGLTQYLQFVLGKTALEAGALMVPLAIGLPIGANISIHAVPRVGTRRVLSMALLGVALVLVSVTQWRATTDVWIVSTTLFFLAIAMANVMAPATASVMGAVPEAKAGVGSAMNDLVRQLGGALGVAIIGSVLNTVYRDRMTDSLAGLPAEAARAAGDSVGAAVAIAGQLGGPAGAALAAAARAAFVDGLGVAVVVAAAVAVLTAIGVSRAMPRTAGIGEDLRPGHEGRRTSTATPAPTAR
jgi:Na+/melibiose symporter-like transporter